MAGQADDALARRLSAVAAGRPRCIEAAFSRAAIRKADDTSLSDALADGSSGELVLTHLRHEAATRIRCIGRTDDMLIVRGVNVFPVAIREIVGEFVAVVSGTMVVKPQSAGVKQDPPLSVSVELARGIGADPDLGRRIGERLRAALVFSARVDLVPWGTMRRSEYKSKLVER